MNASQLGLKLTAERKAHMDWLAGFKTAEGLDMPAEQIGEFHKRNDALAVLQKQYEDALLVEKSAAENELKLAPQGRLVAAGGAGEKRDGSRIETKAGLDAAFKDAFRTHGATLEHLAKGGRGTVSFDLDVEHKTLIQLSNVSPQADRQGFAASAQYFASIEDLFMQGTTDSKSIDYYVETTYTNNAAAVADGSAATDSALAWTLSTDPVEEIQAWIPATRATLADNAGLQSIIQGRLALQLASTVSSNLAAGNGTTPNISGILDRTGIQTQAKGTDPAMDAIHKAITLVEVTGDAPVSAVCVHPTDWQGIRLTRTVDGLYILGNPSEAGPMQLWGIPVRKTTSFGNAGTAVVGAFNTYAQVFNRGPLSIELSTEHSTYFTERKIAIAMLRRLALAVYRENAFAKVTGL